ncbi:MAG: oligosaccharide flippase family protein [Fusobacterium polymorphum]
MAALNSVAHPILAETRGDRERERQINVFRKMVRFGALITFPSLFGLMLTGYEFIVITLSLFLFYFGQFDHAIDEKSSQKGLFLIYSHYPIFIGLIKIETVGIIAFSPQDSSFLLRINFCSL